MFTIPSRGFARKLVAPACDGCCGSAPSCTDGENGLQQSIWHMYSHLGMWVIEVMRQLLKQKVVLHSSWQIGDNSVGLQFHSAIWTDSNYADALPSTNRHQCAQ